ncbi:hypothetical protein NHX12_002527 [Muraenolepis orangiensis]|uniref:Uncharacterized protein n=1 Tax=Muraenolepis orangiensis TaxID=630683 RepID=A0A9Q0DZ04_9TELE|nr:hypothetical protein NHX12_002527 [Muraenolepis orangiensis]
MRPDEAIRCPSDSIMSSRGQLCVVYVLITIGAPCNVMSSHARLMHKLMDANSSVRNKNQGFGKRNANHGSVDR